MEFKIIEKLKGGNKATATGTSLSLQNSIYHCIKKLVFDGRSTQETTNGNQLYDIKDVFIFSSGVTTDNDDWITISYDNTSGTSTKYFDFKTKISENVQPSTNYDLFIEIKSVSGTGTINFVTNQTICQISDYIGTSLANLSIGTIKPTFTTKDDFTGCTSFLNSYATFSAGQSGSITFRISVLKENVKTLDNFVYEPFTGVQSSPSPNYPSEIESIEGTAQYKQVGTQLFNNTSTTDVVSNGITTTFSNNTYTLNGTVDTSWANLTPTLMIALAVGTYKISINEPQNFRVTLRLTTIDNERFDRHIEIGSTSTIFTTTKPMMRTYLYISIATGTTINTSFKFQLQKGDKALPIEVYKETILNIDLQENKLCSLPNGVKDELVVENGRAKIVKNIDEDGLNGSETTLYMISTGLFRYDISNYNSQYILCNYFTNKIDDRIVSNSTANQYMEDNQISARTGDIKDRFYIKCSQFTTLDDFKTWLSTHNFKFQYELAEPQIIDLGAVTTPKTFEGVNNISNSKDANMELTYFNGSLDLSNLEYSIKEV